MIPFPAAEKGTYCSSWDESHHRATGRRPATWDHTVLPATRHKWTRPALTPASKLVLDLPYLPLRDGRLSWQATRQCTDRESNSRSLDHKSDALTTTPPRRLKSVYL